MPPPMRKLAAIALYCVALVGWNYACSRLFERAPPPAMRLPSIQALCKAGSSTHCALLSKLVNASPTPSSMASLDANLAVGTTANAATRQKYIPTLVPLRPESAFRREAKHAMRTSEQEFQRPSVAIQKDPERATRAGSVGCSRGREPYHTLLTAQVPGCLHEQQWDDWNHGRMCMSMRRSWMLLPLSMRQSAAHTRELLISPSRAHRVQATTYQTWQSRIMYYVSIARCISQPL